MEGEPPEHNETLYCDTSEPGDRTAPGILEPAAWRTMKTPPVTLQISLAPSDFPHARFMLAHQVNAWRRQVSEILLTIDFHRSPGRFSAGWQEGAEQIIPLAQSIEGGRVISVDYSEATAARVAAEFFGGRTIPRKDFRGGPYYSYFFGLAEARERYVLHADSDMFFGGRSQTWTDEAITYMAAHPDILITAPLSGPPAADGRLRALPGTPEMGAQHAFRFDVMTTRLFMLDRDRFRQSIGALHACPPPRIRSRVIAFVEGNPITDLPEHLFTAEMRKRRLVRREFLGASPGMWSLHPPYRGPEFYAKLPDLIRTIEGGDVPFGQRGDHDINDTMVNWDEGRAALRTNRIWHRVLRRWRNTLVGRAKR